MRSLRILYAPLSQDGVFTSTHIPHYNFTWRSMIGALIHGKSFVPADCKACTAAAWTSDLPRPAVEWGEEICFCSKWH